MNSVLSSVRPSTSVTGVYVIEIPSGEITHDGITPGETYRVVVFELPVPPESGDQDSQHGDRGQRDRQQQPPEPPVEEGEIREVTIETVSDQGDGIMKVERGYVVIVPGTQPGEQLTVEIEQVQENVAFATVLESDSRSL